MFRGERPLPTRVYGGGSQQPAQGQETNIPQSGGQVVQNQTGAPAATPATSPTVASFTGSDRIPDWKPGFAAPDVNVTPYTPGSVYGPYGKLFGPGTTALGKATEELGKAETGFETGAGSSRSFEGLGGKDLLQGQLGNLGTEGLARDQAIADAKALVGSQYAGPEGLSPESLNTIIGLMTPLEGADPTKGTGTNYFLKQLYPDLTAGELQFEAQKYSQDPAYWAAAQQYMGDLSGVQGQIKREQDEAMTIAEARRKEEGDIAAQSKSFFTGAGQNIFGELDKTVADKQALQKEVADAYEKFFQSGDIKDLQKLQEARPDAFDFDLGKFGKPIRYFEHAKAAYEKVVGDEQYKGIRDMPLLQLGISRHGWPVFQIDQKWLDKHKKLTPEELKQVATMAYQRQQALIGAGFNSFGKEIEQMVPIVKMQFGNQDIEMAMGGQRGDVGGGSSTFAPVVPTMLGNEGWAPQDPRAYIAPEQPQEGFTSVPTRESVASGEQRQVLDGISQILSAPETYGLSDSEPFQAAKLAADMDKWFADNDKLKDEIKGNMSQAEKQYFEDVQAHRKRFHKIREKKKWGHITDLIGNVAFLGLPGASKKMPLTGEGGKNVPGVQNLLSEGAYSLFGSK